MRFPATRILAAVALAGLSSLGNHRGQTDHTTYAQLTSEKGITAE